MVNFLLITSLFLNIIALFCIIVLYLRQNRFIEIEKNQERLLAESEQMISAFILEIKEDNEKFIEKMKALELKQHTELPWEMEKAQAAVTTQIPTQIQQTKGSEPPVLKKGSVYQAVQAYKKAPKIQLDVSGQVENELPPLIVEQPPIVEQTEDIPVKKQESLLEQVLHLQKEGLSIQEISRRLNKGETEIELLIKFQQKSQE